MSYDTVISSRSDQTYSITNPGGNSTAASFASRIPTFSNPAAATSGVVAAGDGIIPVGHGGAVGSQYVLLIPYGAGSATNTFLMKVLGWRAVTVGITSVPTNIPPPLPTLWVPVVIGAFTVTLGTGAGLTGAPVDQNQLFNTTIVQTYGPQTVYSPGSNDIGAIQIVTLGFRFLEVIYNINSSATSCNALYCKL